MTAPLALTGFPTTVTIDDEDLHDYGMTVNNIDNPVPKARKSVTQVFGKDGDFDFSKNYLPRTITFSGFIIADSVADLTTNKDALKNIFKLRENLDSFKVIFQHESDRFWTCKYNGDFSIQNLSNWYSSFKARYTITLKCLKPYSESVAVTSIDETINVFDITEIEYNGNIPTPFNMNFQAGGSENLLDYIEGKQMSEAEGATTWNISGIGSFIASTNNNIFGEYSLFASSLSGNPSIKSNNLISGLDVNKYYVFSAFFNGSATSSNVVKLIIENDGSSGNIEGIFELSSTYKFVYIKISPADMVGATSIKFWLYVSTLASLNQFYIDGCSIFEITSTEYADSDFFPPLHFSMVNSSQSLPGVENLFFRLIYNYNIFRDNENSLGFDTSDGSGALIVDPLVVNNSQLVQTANLYSHLFYVNPTKDYRLSFKYTIKSSNYSFTAVLQEYANNKTSIIKTTVLVSDSSTTTEQTFETVINFNSATSWARIYLANGGTLVYLKDFLLEISDSYSSYIKHDSKLAEYEGAIDDKDAVDINSESLTVTNLFRGANSGNGMETFSGEALLLKEGTNYLTFGSNSANTNSTGVINLTASYRERYL